ncbi:MAG: ribosomal protein S18-alanine N-acetyltransferase [Nitrospirae bacterium]|nr:ribosomal protein S18-alanine N-acetyltransferase [Nitrospirota bacterium]MBI3593948.1 ribosomal protein S18-alanine N-acetyltransferase [Nitrospirota bacterium]
MSGDALEEVLEIANRSFSNPWTREMFENEYLKNPFSEQILVRCEGKIGGYLFMMSLFDECHILDFAVEPNLRRKGIGNKMIAYLIEKMKMKNVRKIFLEVRHSNLPAQSLYQKAGFIQIAVRKSYYSNPKEDAVIFQWKLPEEG